MGISGISPLSLLLILVIVMILFGTNRLRTIGKDLGTAIKNFKEGLEGTNQEDQDNSTSDHDKK